MSKIVEPYDKPNYSPPIRCHRCGTRKADEDVGIFIEYDSVFNENIVTRHKIWLHNEECKKLWIHKYERHIKIVNESE